MTVAAAPYAKFLSAGGRGRFTGFPWASYAGEWIDEAAAEPCVRGIHACRTRDLPFWLDDELWLVELDGPVQVASSKVVARRARLLEPVEAWSRGLAGDLAAACVVRTAEHAATELRAGGLDEAAERITHAIASCSPPGSPGDLSAVAEMAAAGAESAADRERRSAAQLCLYVGDAFEAALPVTADRPSLVAGVAYVAARAAYQRTGSGIGGDDPYLAERRWQASWLATRLPVTLVP